MNRLLTGMESTPEYQLEKTSQQWALSKTTIQGLLDMEVDLVVLRRRSQEGIVLLERTIDSLRKLRLVSQDTEL